MEKVIKLGQLILNKGIIESSVYLIKLIFRIVSSFVKINCLKVRGYNLNTSIRLGGDNDFFQSTKNAITIKSHTRLGKSTKIHSGFGGKIYIGKNVLIDDFTYISGQKSIIIGDHVTIAAFCYIVDFNHLFNESNKSVLVQGYRRDPIVIEDDVWLGTHTIILPGVKVGRGAVIGAGSVVTKDIAPYSIAVGNPARIVKQIK